MNLEIDIVIDGLSVVHDITKTSDQKHVKDTFSMMKKENIGFHPGKYGSKQYRCNRSLSINASGNHGSGANLIISADPYYYKTMPFLKVRANPSEAGYEGWNKVIQIVDGLIPGGYETLYRQGRVSMMDTALDIINGPCISELLIHGKRKRVSCSFNVLNGEAETLYLGSKNSNDFLRCYDKKEESNSRRRQSGMDGEWLRLENSKKKLGMKMSELPNLENVFDGLVIYEKQYLLEMAATYDDMEFELLIGSAFRRGIQESLKSFPEKTRTKFKRRLKLLVAEWWACNSDIWWDEHWKNAVSILDPNRNTSRNL